MKKFLAFLTALLLVASAFATLPVVETTTNQLGFSVYAKRKGWDRVSLRWDSLYTSGTASDTSIVYNLWPNTTIQVTTAGDSARVAVDVYTGLASAATYGTMTKAFTLYSLSAGTLPSVSIPYTGAPMVMFVVRPLPKAGNAVKTRILLTRIDKPAEKSAVTVYADTATLNDPGAFPGVSTTGYRLATFAAKVKKFAAGYTLKFQGYFTTLGGWGNLDAVNDTTVVSDSTGVVLRTFEFPAGVDSVRGYFWSENAGTDHAVTLGIKLVW